MVKSYCLNKQPFFPERIAFLNYTTAKKVFLLQDWSIIHFHI